MNEPPDPGRTDYDTGGWYLIGLCVAMCIVFVAAVLMR